MHAGSKSAQTWRFGVFLVDSIRLEVRRNGIPVKLREQPFQILICLLENAGEIVSREELCRILWPSDTFVDFDQSLNAAVMKLRDALGDSAEAPLYIETIPKHGYRFVAPVANVKAEGTGSSVAAQTDPRASVDEEFSVAVLPFKDHSPTADMAALAAGLSEDVVAGLLRFSYLRVITSTKARDAKDQSFRPGGEEPGESCVSARYILQGSLRQAASRIRVAVRLIDAASGVNLWSESYERPFQVEAAFELQDDLVPRIVSTVGDARGVLPRTISEALRHKEPEQMNPHEAVLRSFAHFQRVTAEEHVHARAALEQAVQLAPGRADCWAMLSLMYREEYTHGFNVGPDPLGRAFSAAQRAVDIDPSNHLGYHALASVFYFQKEFQAFRSAADHAIALNPMDGFTMAYLGFLVAYSGEWECGCAIVERARNLNPHHPGWYWFAHLFDAYRKSDYRRAVDIGLRINMPQFWRTNVALAAAYGQLQDRLAARNSVRMLLMLRPAFALSAREELSKWWDTELVEHLVDGLRKAGLNIPGETEMTAGSATD